MTQHLDGFNGGKIQDQTLLYWNRTSRLVYTFDMFLPEPLYKLFHALFLKQLLKRKILVL